MNQNKELVQGDEVWQLVAFRNMSLWHQLMMNRGSVLYTKNFGFPFRQFWVGLTLEGTKTYLFAERNNIAEGYRLVWEAADTEEKLEKLANVYREGAKTLLTALRECLSNLTSETWEKFQDQYTRFSPGLNVTLMLGRSCTVLINEHLSVLGFSEDEIPGIVGTITYPPAHTPLFISQSELMEIGARVQKGNLGAEALEAALGQWLDKHGIIPVNFCEEPWSMEDAQSQLSAMLRKDCAKELRIAQERHNERVAAAAAKLNEIGDARLTGLARALQECTTLNEFRKNVFCRVSYEYRPLLTQIAAKAGLPHWRTCFYLSPEETLAIVRGGTPDLSGVVTDRAKVGYRSTLEGENEFLSAQDVEAIEKAISSGTDQKVDTAQTTIKGMPACMGKAIGIAKVIMSSKDFAKLQPGEILVAPMTSVDYVPIMERAAAFVTNEGGITSHASIVAREMSKPCIIGTKNATQVIKDGDIVEVDAVLGVVRILQD